MPAASRKGRKASIAYQSDLGGIRRTSSEGAIYRNARPTLQQGKAKPIEGRDARFGFVATADCGCNAHGLFPDTPLLLQPCEEFLGAGIYQLSRGGNLEVRFCRQLDVGTIEVNTDGPPARGGGADFVRVEDFNDQVCALVLAEIQGINDEWTARLYEQRTRFYS